MKLRVFLFLAVAVFLVGAIFLRLFATQVSEGENWESIELSGGSFMPDITLSYPVMFGFPEVEEIEPQDESRTVRFFLDEKKTDVLILGLSVSQLQEGQTFEQFADTEEISPDTVDRKKYEFLVGETRVIAIRRGEKSIFSFYDIEIPGRKVFRLMFGRGALSRASSEDAASFHKTEDEMVKRLVESL